MKIPITVLDYKTLAKSKLSQKIFDYIDSGACDELTKKSNCVAFNKIHLKPLCLKNVAESDLSIELLDQKIDFPAMIAPTALHKLVDSKGEISTAKASKSANIPMVVSSMSSVSLEEIALGSMHTNLWLQIYLFKNRALTSELILRAEKADYKALVITVGIPMMGKRDKNLRNQFSLPPHITTGNFTSNISEKELSRYIADQLDPSVTWKDIEWIQSNTKLPIFLKGIINPLDAETACQLNISGIIVSNHGGRQLDTTVPAISILPEITTIVKNRLLILMDSGIRRGTDILKAVALGANAVLLGRPALWALASAGEAGVFSMLTLLKKEYELALKLCGCNNFVELRKYSKDIIMLK